MSFVLILLFTSYSEAFKVSCVPKTGTPSSFREVSGLVYGLNTAKVYVYGGSSQVIHKDM